MKVKSVLIVIGVLLGCFALVGSANGLGYQSEVDVQFTFNTTCNLEIPATIAFTVAPGTSNSATSNITASCNSPLGGKLTAVVGSSAYQTTNLVNSSGASAVFNPVSGTNAVLTNNTWGYNVNGADTYSALPLYTSSTPALLKNKTSSGDLSVSFKVGALAASTQVAGNYKNVITFSVTENPMPYLQNMAASACDTTGTIVYDNRDGQSYTVKQLADGNCWMMENLLLDPATIATTLNHTNTNMPANTSFTLPASTSSWNLGDSYTTPMINTSNKTTGGVSKPYGVYYNYCAASAGTYCLDSDKGNSDASYDICPAGWHMASRSMYTLLEGYYTTAATFISNLNLPLSGHWGGSSVTLGGSGIFIWASNRVSASSMGALQAASSSINTSSTSSLARSVGAPVRCVMKSS